MSNKDIKDRIKDISSQIASNYEREELFRKKEGRHLPNRRVIIDIIKDLWEPSLNLAEWVFMEMKGKEFSK